MSQKIVGILGGMGPEATLDLFSKIIQGTGAKKDQDHLRILIDNNPKIPDRTLAILGKGPSPLTELVRTAKGLEKAGADFLVIPCVTVHHYYELLQKEIRIPILHIVTETLNHIHVRFRGIRKMGLIATTGTIQTGLFQKAFASSSIELLTPSSVAQRTWVMEAIYGKKGIKAIGPTEDSKRRVVKASEQLIQGGAQAIIAGCTEIPLTLKEGDLPVPVLDPISLLARAAIERAIGSKKHGHTSIRKNL